MAKLPILFLTTSIFAVVGAMPAVAQTAGAAAAETGGNGLGDIIVTARRQEESIQSVPVAVTAISAASLERSSIVNVRDVSRLAPGIQTTSNVQPGDAVIQIRGQVQPDQSLINDASVGIYVDDVYIARSTAALTNFVDISRVEVLKGPQGTLFGKNTTGGAVRIISNEPVNRFEGYGKVGYESYDRYTLEGVLNVPLGETLAARFAGQYSKKSGGYYTNTVTGNPVDHEKTQTIRGILKWKPTDRLTVNLKGDYTRIDAGNGWNTLNGYFPANDFQAASMFEVALEAGLFPFDASFNPDPAKIGQGGALLAAAASAPHGSRLVSYDTSAITATSYAFNPVTGKFTYFGPNVRADPYSVAKVYGFSGNATLDLGFAELKSITAYRNTSQETAYDVDGSKYMLVNSYRNIKAEQFSQELLLNGQTPEGKLNWTLGGNYFQEKGTVDERPYVLTALSALQGQASVSTLGKTNNKSYGIFAQGTYQLSDALSFTAGIRYTIDKRRIDSGSQTIGTDGSSVCTYTRAAFGTVFTSLPNFVAPCAIAGAATFRKVSYTASINYQLDAAKHVYVRTSSGFRAGGINARINAPEAIGSFRPEVVTDYEFGVKADWLDRRLRTNLAVFLSNTRDAQNGRNFVSAIVPGAAVTLVQNEAKRKVYGMEFETAFRASDWLTLDGGASYLHARTDDPNAPDFHEVKLTPEWALRGGFSVNKDIREDLNGNFRFDVSYRSEMNAGDPLRNIAGAIIYIPTSRAVTLVNLRAGLRLKPSGIEISAYARNLTDQLYDMGGGTIGGLGIGLTTMGEGRVLGLDLKIPFGSR